MIALLAAVVATLSVPPYPGGSQRIVAGTVVITTRDPARQARTTYEAAMRKAGWVPAASDELLNGDIPGASKADNEAVRRAGTLLSFERQGHTADIFISQGIDRRRRPVTVLMVLMPDRAPGGREIHKGDKRGRPAR